MLGYESQAVNDQLINVAPGQAYAPLTFGAAYTGPGFWPRGGVYNAPPVIPAPGEWAGSNVDGSIMGGASVGNSPTAGALSASGGVNWMHPTKSPLVMALIFLVVGLFLLHFVHYHGNG
jgi:hypothetical protein